MPKYKPLNYREVVIILRNLGFTQATLRFMDQISNLSQEP